MQVIEAFDIRIVPALLRIGYEYDPVDTAKDQFSRGVVVNLPRDGVQMKSRPEPLYLTGKKSKNRVLSISVASVMSFPFVSGETFS